VELELYFLIDFTDTVMWAFFFLLIYRQKKIAVPYVNSYACCQVLMCTCSLLESLLTLSDRMGKRGT
jgi:hypothetical protein